jgi:dTDP-4-dehydrorhamnose 3,5-epimerase
MRFIDAPLQGIILIEPDIHEDRRGSFLELYHTEKYAKAGLPSRFVQDNFSKSVYGVLRGLHYQRRHPQGKLVMALEGKIFDVAVDIRPDASSFGQWYGVELSAENKRQVYIPPGFAHGYCILSETASVMYKCTDFYFPEDEGGIIWNDPGIDIAWPITSPSLSSKDQMHATLAQSDPQLPRSWERG